MEKTIVIGGKEVKFKSTGAIPLRYKSQFARDYFRDLATLLPIQKELEKVDINSDEGKMRILEKINFDLFYNLAWVLAKTGDKTIKEPMEWLDEFDEFPIQDIMMDIIELLTNSSSPKKK